MTTLPLVLMASLAVCALPANSQTSTTDVFRVSQSGGKWYGKNIGTQPIIGYVIHAGGGELHLNQTVMNVAPAPLGHTPLGVGKTMEILVKPTTQLDIPAVVLQDGTVLGSAVTTEGDDIVGDMFDLWRGEAEELRKWADVAATRPEQFAAELQRAPAIYENSPYTSGQAESRGLVMRLHQEAKDVGALSAELSAHAAHMEGLSVRKVGVK